MTLTYKFTHDGKYWGGSLANLEDVDFIILDMMLDSVLHELRNRARK